MNTKNVRVQARAGNDWVSYKAPDERFLRAILGKHGELRILEVETLLDADIERKEQLENIHTVDVWANGTWRRYSDATSNTNIVILTTIQG